MTIVKNTETDAKALDRQLAAALERYNELHNIPIIELDVDENGNIIVDKDLHPELYDWVVNG